MLFRLPSVVFILRLFAAGVAAVCAANAQADSDSNNQNSFPPFPNHAPALQFAACPGGICPPAFLCPPWAVWDHNSHRCQRAGTICPGDKQVQTVDGPCVLQCPYGKIPHPTDPDRCACPSGQREADNGQCELACPIGWSEDPWNPGTCRTPPCRFNQIELARGVCGCPEGQETFYSDGFGECRVPPQCPEGMIESHWNPGTCYARPNCPHAFYEASETLCCVLGWREDPWNPGTCVERYNCPKLGQHEVDTGFCCDIGYVESAPGSRQCVLPCGDGFEENPFDPGTCRVAFTCPDGRLETEEGVCGCAPGQEDNPFNPGTCRIAVYCPAGMSETSDGACECPSGVDGDQCRADNDARELRISHGADVVGLPYAHGLTLADGTPLRGQGITVGILEFGPLHWRLPDGSVTTHSQLPRIPVFGYDPNGNFDGPANHGLAVAGVMAAKKDGVGVVGVAPEADYVYGVVQGQIIPNVLDETINDRDASIVNNSWGFPGSGRTSDYEVMDGDGNLDLAATQEALRNQLLREGLGRERPALSGDKILSDHYATDPADRPIFVWTTGNRGGASPLLVPGLPRYFPDLTLNNLAVAAVDNAVDTSGPGRVRLTQWRLAGFSNRCGENSGDFCLSAPGVAHLEHTIDNIIGQFGHCPTLKPPIDTNTYEGRRACYELIYKGRGGQLENRYLSGENIWLLLSPEDGAYPPGFLPELDGYEFNAGTSFAAPLVSGALALMKQWFMHGTDCGMGDLCGMGSHELTRRILATADNSGVYADESVYGAGLLDLENALTPQGEMRMMSGSHLRAAKSYSLARSVFRSGPALGDSATRALSGIRMAAFDSHGAPFPVNAESVLDSDNGDSENEALQEYRGILQGHSLSPAAMRSWEFGGKGSGWLSLDGAAVISDWGMNREKHLWEDFQNPYAALSSGGFGGGLSWRGFRAGVFDGDSFRGLAAEFSPLESESEMGFSFQFGGVEELNGFLSSSGSGAFSEIRARTAFSGMRVLFPLGEDWRFRAGGFAGRTSAEGEFREWFGASDDLWSGSFALGLERSDVWRTGDGLRFRIRQPLRASGIALRIPTGRTRYGDLTWRDVSGSPSGRELSLDAGYYREFADGRWLFSAGIVREAGHRSGAKSAGRALFAFERAF